jgi:hypothetical protein
MSCILSDYNVIKLEINSKRNYRKYSNIWRLNDTLLKNQWITEEIRGRVEINKNENTTY